MRVKLTEAQARKLMPFFDRVRATAALGTPGMLLGQLMHDTHRLEYWMDVGFLPHEKAKLIMGAAEKIL